jgi:hypothetical protein
LIVAETPYIVVQRLAETRLRILAVIPPLGGGRGGSRSDPGMLTEPIFSGMNILSLAGFLLMGIGLTFTRQRKVPASSVKNGQPIDLGG